MTVEDAPTWRKSSFCSSNACVEVGRTSDAVLIRDPRNPGIAPLAFTPEEWESFLRGVKAGEFG